MNNRGQYLSFRDPEWWIQSDSTPWRNPYGRWGNEHGTSLYEERYIRPEFVVTVDTSNPNVRRKLEDGLNMAENMLREKASFAIEVSGLDWFYNINSSRSKAGGQAREIQYDFVIS